MGRSKRGYDFLMKFWRFGHILDNWPLIGSKSSEKTTSGHILPVDQEVPTGVNTVMPMQILRPLIERAHGVAILNECMCRRGQKCEAFPHTFGCLLLGKAVSDIDLALARIVGPEEAIAHSEQALRMGLVPLVIHDSTDAWMWGIDFDRMMNICFCCDCCCDVRIALRNQTRGFFENIHRLPGLTVSVTGQCVSCGTCRETCLAGAIELTSDGAHIDDSCKGCGRCVTMCPEHAITMSFDREVDTVGLVLEKYERRSDVGPLSRSRAERDS